MLSQRKRGPKSLHHMGSYFLPFGRRLSPAFFTLSESAGMTDVVCAISVNLA